MIKMDIRAALAILLLLGRLDAAGAGSAPARLADSILVANGPRCASEADIKSLAVRAGLPRGEALELLRETSACKTLFQGLQEDFAREKAVIRFLVTHRAMIAGLEESGTTLMGPDNPIYIGFVLMTGSGVDLGRVDDEEWLVLAGHSLGLSREKLLAGFLALFRHGAEGLLRRLVGQIEANLKETEPARYATHVVYPFLALLHHETLLPPELESALMKGFCQAFLRCEEGNPMRKAVTYYKRLLAGGVAATQPEVDFNRLLGEVSLHIRCYRGRAELYRISRENIPVGRRGIGKVVILEQALPFYLGPERGQSIVGDPDVYVTRDYAVESAGKVREFLRGGGLPSRYRPETDAFWRREGIAMDRARADSIAVRLLRMEFARRDSAHWQKDFLARVAIHEVRHKWDELRKQGPRWVADLEYFAHASEILFGPLPLYSLLGTIRRMEDFCEGIDDRQARSAYVTEIRALWEMAGEIADGTMDPGDLRRLVRKRYAAFATRDGGDKGDLGEFAALAKPLVAAR